MGLPVAKHIGIYAMTEELVTGTRAILERHRLPYLPMVHCFLGYRGHRVDLTEGNCNGKNGPIDAFLHTVEVAANIPGIEEYRLYRRTLQQIVLLRGEFGGVDLKTVLKARGEGIALLKSHAGP